MHPVITLLGFIVWSGFLSRGSPEVLVASASVAGIALRMSGRASSELACRLLRRLRWLWFSIVILYVFFTPGQAIIQDWEVPSVEGLYAGAYRIALLSVTVLLVSLLVTHTPRDELIAAIYTLAKWYPGRFAERVAVRIQLVLEVLPALEDMLRIRINEGARIVWRKPLRAGEALASVFESVVQCAEATPIKRVRIPDLGAPSFLQWGVLAGVLALLLALQNGL
ncbi:MAG: hypothetical protein ACREVH_05175 [Gammaproteobacteria bacterium]